MFSVQDLHSRSFLTPTCWAQRVSKKMKEIQSNSKSEKPFVFCVSAIDLTYETMTELVECMEPIQYSEFVAQCDTSVFEALSYDEHFPISKDPLVKFWKGMFRDEMTYCITHSRIEYVFVARANDAQL